MITLTTRYADSLDMLTTATATSSSNSRPSSARECAIRNTLRDLPCFTCGLPVDWTVGQHGHDGAAWLGHVIARECWTRGGGYVAGNIGAQCRTCQYDARHLPDGGRDLSAYVIPGTVPEKFLPTKGAGDDLRTLPAPAGATATRSERRAARGKRWGW